MLESLLLDRSLGELSPEVAALLDEYLARDAQAAREAASLSNTLALARTAVRLSPASPLPPLDRTPLWAAVQRTTMRSRPGEWLRLAACLIVGLGVGWLARPSAPAPAANASFASSSGEVHRARPVASSAGLWSRSRLAAEHAASTPRPYREPPPAGFPSSPTTSPSKEHL